MAATDNMIDYAMAIADTLGIDEPDYSSFRDTSNFISENVKQFRQAIRREQLHETINAYEQTHSALSKDFVSLLERAEGKAGVYCLWCDRQIVYIGKSIDLQQRVITSLKERSRACEIDEITMIFTPTHADMHILEVYLITYYKPMLNKDCVCNDDPILFKAPLDDLCKNEAITPVIKIYEGDKK